MKTINDVVDEYGVTKNRVYQAIKEGDIPAEKKKYKDSRRKAYVIEDDFFNQFESVEEFKDYVSDGIDGDKAVTFDDLNENITCDKNKLYKALKEGVIPAKKVKIKGKPRKAWVVDEEFLKDNSYEDMKKMIDSFSHNSRKNNKQKNKEIDNLFSAREIAGNFDIDLKVIRRLLAIFKEKNIYEVKAIDGILYMKMEDIVNMDNEEMKEYIKKYVRREESRGKDDWDVLVELWYEEYKDSKVRANQIANIAKSKGLLLDILNKSNMRSELINLGKKVKKRVDKDINGYKIKVNIHEGTANEYYLEKIEEENKGISSKLGKSYYIYEIYVADGKKALEDRLFTFTACDGNWDKVSKELEKIMYFVKNETRFSEKMICDCKGNIMKDDEFEEDFWYFSTLPNPEFKDKFVFSTHSTDGYGNYHQYYISPFELEWLDDEKTINIYEISDMDYTISKFQDEHPEMADNMELIKEIVKNMRRD
jgi:DNA-binding transcriptional regulator YhcF (GntR family)